MNSNDNKTPLEYYERAIQELTNTREQFQTELESLREMQDELKSTKDELAQTKAKLDDTQRELSNTKQELQQKTEPFEKLTQKIEARVNYCYSDTQNIKNKMDTELETIRKMQGSYQTLKDELATTQAQLYHTQRELSKTKQELQHESQLLKAQLNRTQAELSNTKQELQQKTEPFEKLTQKIEARVNYCYSDTQNIKNKMDTELETLRKMQGSYQTLKDELAETKAKLDDTQRELSNTKQELQQKTEPLNKLSSKIEAQVNYCYSEIQKEIQARQQYQKHFYESFKSIFVHANSEKEQNYTNNTNWETVVSYNLEVLTDSQVNVIAHGHGYTESYKAPLDIRIFIDDEIYDEKYWGLGITHSHSWQTLVCLFIKVLTPGTHKIELKYRSRTGKKSVHLNYPSLLIMLSPINN